MPVSLRKKKDNLIARTLSEDPLFDVSIKSLSDIPVAWMWAWCRMLTRHPMHESSYDNMCNKGIKSFRAGMHWIHGY